MRQLAILAIVISCGIAAGVIAFCSNNKPQQPAVGALTVTVVLPPEQEAERIEIQKILDTSFPGSEVTGWWPQEKVTTISGINKTGGQFHATYDRMAGTLSLEYDRDAAGRVLP